MIDRIDGLEVHALAGLVPLADELEQESLRVDIEANGQLVPILLYKNKIVDGRCRALACQALQLSVDFVRLPNNLTLEEVALKVQSLNTRRNLTKTQKAIIAAGSYLSDQTQKQRIFCIAWGVNKVDFAAAKYLIIHEKHSADLLEKGGAIEISKGVWSKSVRTVADNLKIKISGQVSTMPNRLTLGQDFNNLIQTPAGHRAYKEGLKLLGGARNSYDGDTVKHFLASIADQFTAPKPNQP